MIADVAFFADHRTRKDVDKSPYPGFVSNLHAVLYQGVGMNIGRISHWLTSLTFSNKRFICHDQLLLFRAAFRGRDLNMISLPFLWVRKSRGSVPCSVSPPVCPPALQSLFL
jgi:hypothetical protein